MRHDLDRRDVRDVDGFLGLPDELRFAQRDARRRDLDLRREQEVPARPPAGIEGL